MDDIFIKNIVKKNLNNKLEEVLSKKKFSEDVKNTLLSIFYKIENGYEDYRTVKRDTFEKKTYIQKLTKIIDKNCDKIEFINLKDKKLELIDKEKKYIRCYPIDNNILYSIAKLEKNEDIVKYIDNDIDEAFTFVLNTGNNINIIEPIRDFNGFSWNIVTKDIEDINCNLIYQNIIYLAGNVFLEKWVNNYDSVIDYFELFQEKIEEKYGKKLRKNIMLDILRLSVLIYSKYDKKFETEIKDKKNQFETRFYEIENKEEYLTKISKIKKQKEIEIRKLDRTINDKKLILEEYERRNEKLPLEKKIFSARVLKNMLKEERENKIQEIESINKMMKPKEFLKQRELAETKFRITEIMTDNLAENLENTLLDLQENILQCIFKDITKAKDKNELLEMIYKYRYYYYLPFSNSTTVGEEDRIKGYIKKIEKLLIDKSVEIKTIPQILNDKKENYEITRKILLSKIISLQDINFKIEDEKNNTKLIVYDDDTEDVSFLIQREEAKVRFNKKMKFFLTK